MFATICVEAFLVPASILLLQERATRRRYMPSLRRGVCGFVGEVVGLLKRKSVTVLNACCFSGDDISRTETLIIIFQLLLQVFGCGAISDWQLRVGVWAETKHQRRARVGGSVPHNLCGSSVSNKWCLHWCQDYLQTIRINNVSIQIHSERNWSAEAIRFIQVVKNILLISHHLHWIA